jgi:hypothetical protein
MEIDRFCDAMIHIRRVKWGRVGEGTRLINNPFSTHLHPADIVAD